VKEYERTIDKPENRITKEGLIYGTSAGCNSLNVKWRLNALNELYTIEGAVFADIGCGRGSYSIELAKYCQLKMYCIDIVEKNVEITKEVMKNARIEMEYSVSEAEKIDIKDETCDCVFIIEVLDHVNDVRQSINNAYRILKPGGRCYISVPNKLFPFETHPVKIGRRLYNRLLFPFLPWIPFLHRRIATARVFSQAPLVNEAREVGFKDIKITYVMPPFEKRGGAFIRGLAARLNRTPLKIFGVSLLAVFIK